MRPGQQNKRGRGRNNNNNQQSNNSHRKGGNPLTRTYDSSGPDVKIRGTAQHIAEKYGALARDAQSAGDRVMAENYLQHAEHYNRIIAAAQAQMQDRFPRDERADAADRGDFADRDGFDRDPDEIDSTPVADQQPVPAPAPAPAAVPVAAPVAAAEPAPEIDGSGPQPVIEGVPAEVALEEEGAAPARGQTRRRTAARPRRTRRGEAQAAGEGGEAPALETAASE